MVLWKVKTEQRGKKMNKKGFIDFDTIGAVALLLFFGFTFVWLVSTIFIGYHIPGQGTHTVYVTATETSGLIYETSKVYVKSDLASTQEDIYCVNDPHLLSELDLMAQQKQRITLHYKNGFIIPRWVCSPWSESIVTGFVPTTTNQ